MACRGTLLIKMEVFFGVSRKYWIVYLVILWRHIPRCTHTIMKTNVLQNNVVVHTVRINPPK